MKGEIYYEINREVQLINGRRAKLITMENEEKENANSQNGTEETGNSNDSTQDTGGTGVDIEAEVKKATAPLYARMKQAEAEAREAKAKLAERGTSGEVNTKGSLSTVDLMALVNHKVNEEDIPEVENYARFKGISIAEALKTTVVKSLLSEKEEMRKTASATNVKNSRVAVNKVNPSDLLDKARAGEKIDDKDIEALARARMEEKYGIKK